MVLHWHDTGNGTAPALHWHYTGTTRVLCCFRSPAKSWWPTRPIDNVRKKKQRGAPQGGIGGDRESHGGSANSAVGGRTSRVPRRVLASLHTTRARYNPKGKARMRLSRKMAGRTIARRQRSKACRIASCEACRPETRGSGVATAVAAAAAITTASRPLTRRPRRPGRSVRDPCRARGWCW